MALLKMDLKCMGSYGGNIKRLNSLQEKSVQLHGGMKPRVQIHTSFYVVYLKDIQKFGSCLPGIIRVLSMECL